MDIKDMINGLEGIDDSAKETLVTAISEAMSEANKKADQAIHSRSQARELEKAAKAELSELREQLEELQNKDMSAADKAAKDLEKLQKQVADLAGERDALTGKLAQTERDNLIGRIHDGVKWNRDLIPAEDTLAGISRKLDGIDLADDSAVKAAVDEYVTARPHYVLADSKGGAGSRNDGASKGGGAGGFDAETVDISSKEALNAALSQG